MYNACTMRVQCVYVSILTKILDPITLPTFGKLPIDNNITLLFIIFRVSCGHLWKRLSRTVRVCWW